MSNSGLHRQRMSDARPLRRFIGAILAVFLILVGSCLVAVDPASANPSEPDAPTINLATPGDEQVSIDFTPGDDGGDAIMKYEYELNHSGSWSDAWGTSSPVSITGLANGTSYSIRLRAVNTGGNSAESNAVSVTPFTTPSAPTLLDATPGDGSALIAFSPGDDGGDAITRYEYELDYSGSWADFDPVGTSSPASITGLTNGTSYSIRLRAVNTGGAGAESSPFSVTPFLAPAEPTSLIATVGNTTVSISFTPGADGTYPITKYQYTTDDGASWTDVSAGGTSSPVTINGLTNYTTYSIKLRAYSTGGGTASTAVSVETKNAAPTITTAYSARKSGVANRGIYVEVGTLTPSNGIMLNYTVTAYTAGTNTVVSTCTGSSRRPACFLTGLTTGTRYDLRATGALRLTGTPLITRSTFESTTRTVRV